MAALNIMADPKRVNAYLEEHKLVEGSAELEAVLLQFDGTSSGRPAVLLVATIDGQKRVIKTTLRLLLAGVEAFTGAAEQDLGPHWRGP